MFLRRQLNIGFILAAYTGIFCILTISIFGRIFPDCFIEGSGLTSFKIISEYIISMILLTSFFVMYRKRCEFDPYILKLVVVSIIMSIGAELAFTFYISAYGFSNLVGHYFKLFSFYLIYKAIIETGLKKPYNLLFRNLDQHRKLLGKAKDVAEAANRTKSIFLANMSHELRTPLNSVLGYAQILRRDENATEFQRERLDMIEWSGNHLLSLINEILDLSKIEARKMEIHRTAFRFHEFLEGICGMIRVRVYQKKLLFHAEIAPDLPDVVRGDEMRLGQILLNLLGNAVKFTDQGRVTLKVSVRNEAGGTPNPGLRKICFRVEDTGVGIPENRSEDIFLPFSQVGDHTRKIEGTGLGLAISRKLVRMMGGELYVTSTQGRGSMFMFDLELPLVLETSVLETSEVLKTSEVWVGGLDSDGKKDGDFVIPLFSEAKTLYKLGMSGKVVELCKELDTMELTDEQYVPFVQELRRLARAFQVAEIREFLKKYLKGQE